MPRKREKKFPLFCVEADCINEADWEVWIEEKPAMIEHYCNSCWDVAIKYIEYVHVYWIRY